MSVGVSITEPNFQQQENSFDANEGQVFADDVQEPDCSKLKRRKKRAFMLRGHGPSTDDDAGGGAGGGENKDEDKDEDKDKDKDKEKEKEGGGCEKCKKTPEKEEIDQLKQRIRKLDFTIACLMRLIQVIN